MPEREKKEVKHVSKKRYVDNPKRDNIDGNSDGDGDNGSDPSGNEGLAQDELLNRRHPYNRINKDSDPPC